MDELYKYEYGEGRKLKDVLTDLPSGENIYVWDHNNLVGITTKDQLSDINNMYRNRVVDKYCNLVKGIRVILK